MLLKYLIGSYVAININDDWDIMECCNYIKETPLQKILLEINIQKDLGKVLKK